MAKNFAVIGVGGYIAPRHLRAIRDTGNRIIAAIDPKDSVGILDQFEFDVDFFTEIERFDRHLEKLRRGPEEQRVHYVTICSPNYLHDAHCRLAMRVGANVICEKPLVINPWNLDALEEIERETGKQVNTVLQLRVHPKLLALRETTKLTPARSKYIVRLTYVTARGRWYHQSWKGIAEKSGGVATNIGIHLFDLLLWLFGGVIESRVYHADAECISGFLDLERARVQWFLSVDPMDLPFETKPGVRSSFRSITIDGQEAEFTEGFTDLHTCVYEKTLAGSGFGINDARPSVELVHRIRTSVISPIDEMAHPYLDRKRARLA